MHRDVEMAARRRDASRRGNHGAPRPPRCPLSLPASLSIPRAFEAGDGEGADEERSSFVEEYCGIQYQTDVNTPLTMHVARDETSALSDSFPQPSTDRHSRVQFQSLCVRLADSLCVSLSARDPRDPRAAPQHSTHSARLCACQVRVPSLPRYTHMHTNQFDIDLLQLHTYTSEPQKTRANVRKRTVVFALATCGGLRPAALPRPRT